MRKRKPSLPDRCAQLLSSFPLCHRRTSTFPLCVLGLVAACADAPSTADQRPATGYAIAWLTADLEALLAETDVRSVRFEATRVACAGEAVEPEPETYVGVAPLEEHAFPADNPTFANEPLAPDSQHLFADNYMVLAPGCYDVTATPVTAEGAPSEHCAAAQRAGLEVFAGQSTEIVLVHQCESPEGAGGDVIAVLNHPPRLTDLTLPSGRFGDRCAPQEACVTVTDVEADPVELVWAGAEDLALPYAGPVVQSTTELSEGSLRHCVRLMPQGVGEYVFVATAHDLLHRSDGSLVRIEDWLSSTGSETTSHASVTFSMHASTGLAPSPEVCDRLDNDCDFEIDEGACSGGLKVQYRRGDTATNDHVIAPVLRIVNESAETIPLSELLLHYYYSREASRTETVQCRAAQVDCSAVATEIFVSRPSRPGANQFLEIAFRPSAGTIAPGQTVEVALELVKSGGSYAENNDYSFDSGGEFVDWQQVPLYRIGLPDPIWGVEP